MSAEVALNSNTLSKKRTKSRRGCWGARARRADFVSRRSCRATVTPEVHRDARGTTVRPTLVRAVQSHLRRRSATTSRPRCSMIGALVSCLLGIQLSEPNRRHLNRLQPRLQLALGVEISPRQLVQSRPVHTLRYRLRLARESSRAPRSGASQVHRVLDRLRFGRRAAPALSSIASLLRRVPSCLRQSSELASCE